MTKRTKGYERVQRLRQVSDQTTIRQCGRPRRAKTDRCGSRRIEHLSSIDNGNSPMLHNANRRHKCDGLTHCRRTVAAFPGVAVARHAPYRDAGQAASRVTRAVRIDVFGSRRPQRRAEPAAPSKTIATALTQSVLNSKRPRITSSRTNDDTERSAKPPEESEVNLRPHQTFERRQCDRLTRACQTVAVVCRQVRE